MHAKFMPSSLICLCGRILTWDVWSANISWVSLAEVWRDLSPRIVGSKLLRVLSVVFSGDKPNWGQLYVALKPNAVTSGGANCTTYIMFNVTFCLNAPLSTIVCSFWRFGWFYCWLFSLKSNSHGIWSLEKFGYNWHKCATIGLLGD